MFTKTALDAEMVNMMSMMWSALYQAPAFAGYGDHWPITEPEAHTLAQLTKSALDALPNKQRKAFQERLAKFLPITTLCGTVISITIPKVLLTRAGFAGPGESRHAGPVSDFNSRARQTAGSGPAQNATAQPNEQYTPTSAIPTDPFELHEYPQVPFA
jgi:hypothetical protein